MTDPPPLYQQQDQLPPSYTCTVYKQGYVCIKKELNMGGYEETQDRSWRTVYFKLRGTLLKVYKNKHLLCTMSMLQANCGIAPDYKTKHILRLRLDTTKEQYLIRGDTMIQVISWFEHLQCSINISTDIDKRRMPQIFTLARGEATRTVTLIVGKTQAVVPVLQQ